MKVWKVCICPAAGLEQITFLDAKMGVPGECDIRHVCKEFRVR